MIITDIPGQLPLPKRGHEVGWVQQHLGDLCCDAVAASPRFRGTQEAADVAQAQFDVTGYATRRNEVLPRSRRGASGLSPYIRHGLLPLPRVWNGIEGPGRDVAKFRDELLWQEYARHVYARFGYETRNPIRYEPRDVMSIKSANPWDRDMACVDLAIGELEDTGWMVNQTRMWMASHWNVRHGAHWRDGEDHFFRHLLDGSRAANRLGWQWTIGAGTGKAYGFSRSQVENRAPGLCDGCEKRHSCPIEKWPNAQDLASSPGDPRVRGVHSVDEFAGPTTIEVSGDAGAVWLTAESLGDDDPAFATYRELPAVFVFDEPLLATLQLSGKRLVFLAERLSEIAEVRSLIVLRGDPATVLRSIPLATTFTPVPGWHQRRAALNVVSLHPWLWLRRPSRGSVASFSAWNKR